MIARIRASVQRHRIPLFFVLLFVLYWKAPDYIGMSPASRFDLTKAIVLDHSFKIDKYVSNTCDWSQRDGHYYTNKAPGGAMLAAPFYLAFVSVERALGRDPLVREIDINNLRRVDLFVTALPSVLLSLFMLLYLLDELKAQGRPTAARDAWLITFTYAVATIAFPYSTMFWGHQTAGAFLFLSFIALRKRLPAVAGFLAAAAVLVEYSTLLGVAGLGLYCLFSDRASRSPRERLVAAMRFCAGALPVLAVFLLYHRISFGGWTELPLSQKYLNPALSEGGEETKLFGVLGLPSGKALFGVTFGIERGLFFLSPVLIFALVGFYRWLREPSSESRSTSRADAWLAAWIVFSGVWFNISYKGWYGGWCIGPRYLTPILPFFALGLSRVRPGRLYKALLAISVLNMLAICAVDMQPHGMTCTLAEKIYPDLLTKPHLWPMFAFMTVIAVILYALCEARSEGAASP